MAADAGQHMAIDTVGICVCAPYRRYEEDVDCRQGTFAGRPPSGVLGAGAGVLGGSLGLAPLAHCGDDRDRGAVRV